MSNRGAYYFSFAGAINETFIDGDVYQYSIDVSQRLGYININKKSKIWYGVPIDGIGLGWANGFFMVMGLNIEEYEFEEYKGK
jgi:hypothetical protein